MYFIFHSFGFFHGCSGKGCWVWPWLSIQRLVSVWDLTSSSECSRTSSEAFMRLVGDLRLHQNSAVLSKPAYETLKSYINLKYDSVLSETEVTFPALSSPQHRSGWVERAEEKEKMFIFSCMWLRGTAGEIRKTHQRNMSGSRVSSIWWLNPSKQTYPAQKEVWKKRRIKKKSGTTSSWFLFPEEEEGGSRGGSEVMSVQEWEGRVLLTHCGCHIWGILFPWYLILKWKPSKILETNAE